MKHPLIIVGIVSLIGLVATIFFFERHVKVEVERRVAPAPDAAAIQSAPSDESTRANIDAINKVGSKEPLPRIVQYVKIAARKVGQLDENPQKTASDLAKMANQLTPLDLKGLRKLILNKQEPVDERFFAAYLVAQSNKERTIELIRDVALTKYEKMTDIRTRNDEQIIRAQLIEGLPKFGEKSGATLLEIINNTDDVFLRDRANRALIKARHPDAKSLQQQDAEALQKLQK